MTKRFFMLVLAFFILFPGAAFAQAGKDIPLPAVSALSGTDFFEALRQRESLRAYAAKELSAQDLGDVLWAANGVKSPGGKWVIPYARHTDPTFRVYVTKRDGTYLYDGVAHALKFVNGQDLRSEVGLQDFVSEASAVLIFVANPMPLLGMAPDRSIDDVLDTVYLSCGAAMQDVYLAAAAKKLATCFVESIREDGLKRSLNLSGDDIFYGIMPIGYPAE